MKFVFDRRHRATSIKPGSVELQIYYGNQRKWITTGVRLLPKQWRDGYVIGRIDAPQLNECLALILTKAQKLINAGLNAGELSLEDLAIALRPKGKPKAGERRTGEPFIDFCRERTTVRKYGKKADSQDRYNRFMRFFTSWRGITHFEDITEAKVIEMDETLAAKGLKDNTKWNNYHRFLNSYIIDAIDEGLIRRNPYKHVKINKQKQVDSLHKHLTIEEFRHIESMALPTESLRQVRDVFVFQTYTCLSYTDLAAFDVAQIREINGRDVYMGKRGKTGQEYVFLLLRQAREILDRYDGKLPIISNAKYNQFLKALAQHAGIDKPVSSHWARHTGATLLLNMGVSMEVVAKVLGHSSTKITRQVYAKLLDATVVDAMAEYERRFSIAWG